MKELQPINQNVVIEPEEEKELRTPSGLYIPDTAKEKKASGKVIAISNIENPEIAVGDVVIYKSYSGNEVELDDKKYLIVQYSDILAKVVETEEI
jgi:chaperonin GroES